MKFVELRTKIREWVVQSFFARGSNPVENLSRLDMRERQSLCERIGVAKVHPGPKLPDSKTLRYLIQAYIATTLQKHVLSPFLPGMSESTGGCIGDIMGEWVDECHCM